MTEPTEPTGPTPSLDAIGHPRGTLAIVAVYGLLFAAGWVALFFLYFMERGAPQP
jgi:hypothetical protein